MTFNKTNLSTIVDLLPVGYYLIGDAAYVCGEHLLTPFSGDLRNDPTKDVCNFHLSQLRIRIEMTFQRFMKKWLLFKRPLQIRLKNVGRVFMCATRLHNFCINEHVVQNTALVSVGEEEPLNDYIPSDIALANVAGNSVLRDLVVAEIQQHCLTHPSQNIKRNKTNI